jgi:two-component system cell cycle sensor histidine kinase/response regulator CckA
MSELIERTPTTQLAFDNAPVGIVVADLKGTILRANRAFLELLGYTQDDLASLDYTKLLFHDDVERDSQLFRELVRGQRTGYSVEQRAIRKSGHQLWVEAVVTLVGSESNHPAYAVAVVQDITKRRAVALELAERRKLEMLARITGGIAHDFNNLLMVIRGELELLGEVPDERVRLGIGTAMRTVDHAASIVRQLLALGRQQVLLTEVVSLNDLLRSNEDVLRRILPRDISFNLALDEDVPTVEIDVGGLFQVVMNLVLNARDALGRGGAVRIRTYSRSHSEEAPGRKCAVVEVSDTGEGIAPEVMERLFEPFVTTKSNGVGLGLATSYGMVKQSGGDIEVTSQPGEGSVFRVVLPASTAAVPASTDELRVPPSLPPPADAGELILLIEDQESVRSVIARALRRAGYRVIEAATLDDVARTLSTMAKQVDLILSDVVLPGTESTDLWTELSRRARRTPVVFMSGYAKDIVERKIPVEDVRWFLEKPFRITELLSVVDAARRSRVQDEGNSAATV